jgi:putative transcriptional regulator
MIEKPYIGQLLAANPNNPKDGLSGSVILIVNHNEQATVGIQVNARLLDMELSGVMSGLGIDYIGNDPLYRGGNIDGGKVHVIHSTDWEGMSTVKINDQLAITNDLSILAAISQGEGPEYFRACVGFWMWEAGVLEIQLNAKIDTDVQHRWESITGNVKNVFENEGVEQWYEALESSARKQVSHWF